jgi:hypothetical protein
MRVFKYLDSNELFIFGWLYLINLGFNNFYLICSLSSLDQLTLIIIYDFVEFSFSGCRWLFLRL